MGIEDRDWYWKSRAARKSADDAYFLRPKRIAPSPRRMAGVVAFVLALALGVFAVRQGWFAQEPQPSREAVARELEALRQWDERGSPSRPAPIVHPRRADAVPPAAAPERPDRRAARSRATAPERSDTRRTVEQTIEAGLVMLALASPFTLFALLIALFFRRTRGSAGWGLLGGGVGFFAGFAGLWGWIKHAVDMGGVFQFVAHVAGSFTLGALVAIAIAEATRFAQARRSRPDDDVATMEAAEVQARVRWQSQAQAHSNSQPHAQAPSRVALHVLVVATAVIIALALLKGGPWRSPAATVRFAPVPDVQAPPQRAIGTMTIRMPSRAASATSETPATQRSAASPADGVTTLQFEAALEAPPAAATTGRTRK